MDYTRRCYSAWMLVPEYTNPIRVRWYRPNPDAPLGDPDGTYQSSDWDDDHSFNPLFGEQGGMRNPNLDWRRCSPPPWYPKMDCPNCPNGAAQVYTLTSTGWLNNGFGHNCTALNGTWDLTSNAACKWESPVFPVLGTLVHWELEARAGNAIVRLISNTGSSYNRNWTLQGWDPHARSSSFPFSGGGGGPCLFTPPTVTIAGP